MSEINYLECKNSIVEVLKDNFSIQLPICPICNNPIEGFIYFQAFLSSERMHLDCFFKSVNANSFYINEFNQDTLLPIITKERETRWLKYLQSIKGSIKQK